MAVKKAPHLNIDTVDENGSSPLILAALNGHRSVVHLLLSYSANVAIVDHQGWVWHGMGVAWDGCGMGYVWHGWVWQGVGVAWGV